MLRLRHLSSLIIVAAILAALSCGGEPETESGTGVGGGDSMRVAAAERYLAQLFEAGEVIVITRNAPTTWYHGVWGDEGIEAHLAHAFGRDFGLTIHYEFRETVAEVLESLRRGEGHFAAAGLTLTPERTRQFLQGPVYQTVRQQVISRRGETRPRNTLELVGREIAVVSNSSYVDRLRELQRDHPGLAWTEVDTVGTERLLRDVWNRRVDVTIADDNIVAINRRFFPELIVAFHLSEPESLVWYFNDAAQGLWELACKWFPFYEASGDLARTHELYYGHVDTYDYVDTRRFIERIETRLPKYRPLFETVAEEHAMRWTIPAAISYQESHWRPNAKSPTGVRGMMMLTQATAREVGVTNRLDAEQSVRGGMKYLAQIFNHLPESIQVPDRYWITLAAYNVGYYHVMDARVLARRLGRNPDVWADLVQVLPLLAERKYYKTLRYGYARGYEPVRYVTRIRDYEDILAREVGKVGQ